MSKYKQTVIPATTSEGFADKDVKQLRRKVYDYYKQNIIKKEVVNIDLGITIQFIRAGGNKVAYGGNIYTKKACAIQILPLLIKYAKYSNWGDRKNSDNPTVVGYFNFKVKARIDNKIEYFHLVIQLRNNGKFYYTHEVNIWHKKAV